MNSSSDEYLSALEILHSSVFGKDLVQEVSSFSHLLGDSIFDVLERKGTPPPSIQPFIQYLLKNDLASMAFCLLGRRVLIDCIEKNLVLLLGRLLTTSRMIDTLSLHEKLSIVAQGIVILSARAHDWNVSLEESTRHIHDKKERRERRHLLQQEVKHHAEESLPHLSEAVLRRLFTILIPHGIASLYLPQGGEVFLPKLQQMLDSAIPSIAQWFGELLFRRDLKIDFLYYLYSGVSSWVTKSRLPSEEAVTIEDSSDLVSQVTPVISPLCHAFLPSLSIANGVIDERLASKAIEITGAILHSISLESLLVAGCFRCAKISSISFTSHTELELDRLIEVLSSDERIAQGIVKAAVPSPDLPIPTKTGTAAAFFELVLYGLKASASEILAKGALASFNWEEAQRLCLERVRWFVLSSYFDEAILEVSAEARFAESQV